MVEWRFHVHDDDEYVSIGQEHKNDTLLKMPDGWRDREVVRGFADAFLACKAERDRLREGWKRTLLENYPMTEADAEAYIDRTAGPKEDEGG